MKVVITIVFFVISAVFAIATLFFGYYGTRLVHLAITFDGEGSLGHVGMYLGAVLFPFLALLCGAFTYLAWRTARRRTSKAPPSPGQEISPDDLAKSRD